MWPYWLMFGLPGLATVWPFRADPGVRKLGWYAVILLCAVMVGLRHEVGADWGNYYDYFELVRMMDFKEALEFIDPGYSAVNWIVIELGGDVHWVNIVCAIAVMAGVSVFSEKQADPWLALSVAVPYFVIVVGMGYSRQGAALGLVLLGFAALSEGRTRPFVVWVLIGALFHKSAVLVLPIAVVAGTERRAWTIVWVFVTTALGALLLIAGESEELWSKYVEADMKSEGGLIRVGMNTVPAVIYLASSRRFKLREGERRLWWWMSLFALTCIPLVQISSTAVDRVALYFIPIQIFVFSRLSMLVSPGNRWLMNSAVVLYYASVLFVWLNFAVHASLWIPYDMQLP